MKEFTIPFKVLYLACIALIFNSCIHETESTTQSKSANKIMPLGASRVEGNRPTYESFRYELWKDLTDNGWDFDFIGTKTDKATYPNYNSIKFDMDHEGRGGWTSGDILGGINSWLNEAGKPDIVLFSSPGGNDALQDLSYDDAISNINSIIDALQASNPDVTIIIEQMAPGHSGIMTQKLKDYFEDMQQDVVTIATEQTTSTSKVIAVDMYTGFTDNMFADAVHYNESGADFIATRYYAALVDVMEK